MPTAPIGFGRAALHLGALWAVAFAQPLFALLAGNAEFFVARGSTRGDIVLLGLGYAVAPPLAGALAVRAAGTLRPALGWALQLVLIGLLAGALVLPPLGTLAGGSAAAVVFALAAAAVAALAYARTAVVRAFLTALSPAPLLVAAWFLLLSPVSALVLPAGGPGAVAGPARSSTPVVVVLLDELPVTTLTRDGRRIDAALFPNLARFAREATWYRRATTVADGTTEAVPALLTGVRPGRRDLPTWRQHPRNLLTLFARSHDVHAFEPITELCPPDVCPRPRPPTGARLRALAADVGVMARHVLLPRDLRTGLPRIDQAWGNFGERTPSAGPVAAAGTATRAARGRRTRVLRTVLTRLRSSDAPAAFAAADAVLAGPRSARPPLLLLHSTLPHAPWRHLPDGRTYPLHRVDYPGVGRPWGPRQWVADQSFQRHVLQVQFVDALLGRLLARLRRSGFYDEAVVVVASDHGASFQAGTRRRWVQRRNAAAIAGVPLIVKRPGQTVGRIHDGAVRTVDVLPTIAAAAAARVPWRTHGEPADRRPEDPDAVVEVARAGRPGQALTLRELHAAQWRRDAHEARLLRHGRYAVGPRPDLLGRRVGRVPAAGPGVRATVDGGRAYGDIRPGARVVPALVSGAVRGLRRDAVLAVAVDGRIAATTWVDSGERRRRYAALLPPRLLRDGPVSVAVLQVLAGRTLRRIGGAPSGQNRMNWRK